MKLLKNALSARMVCVLIAVLIFALIPLQAMAAENTTADELRGSEEASPAPSEAKKEMQKAKNLTANEAGESEFTAQATTVTLATEYPDAGLRAAVVQALKGLTSPTVTDTTYVTAQDTELARIAMLQSAPLDGNTTNEPVLSLAGTVGTYLTGVNTIEFTSGDIATLDPIAQYPNLTMVTLDNCDLVNCNLNVFNNTNLKWLEYLSLKGNNLTDTLVGNIASTGLKTLDLSDNGLTTASSITKFTALEEIRLNDNNIASIAPLSAQFAKANITATGQTITMDVAAKGAGYELKVESPVKDETNSYVALTSFSDGGKFESPNMVWPSLPADQGMVHCAFNYTKSSTKNISFAGNVTVKYTKSAFTVTYEGNGNTSGSVPVDSTPYLSGESATVLSPPTSFAKTGFVFDEWNTQANGKGTSYAVGATFPVTANTALYAQWDTVTHTITATAGPNGTITESGTVKVADGDSYTFRFTPSTGYQVYSVVIDSVTTYTTETSYTFSDVTADHTIYVTFSLATSPTSTYTASPTSTYYSTTTSPQTGDETNIMFWFMLAAIGAGVLLITLEYRRYKKASKKSK